MHFIETKNEIIAVFLVGLIVRLGLAPFTGHPYDLGLLAYSERLLYEGKIFDVFFPTLPAVYYVQLVFYAPYELLRIAGLRDARFLYQTPLMIEDLFLKLPMILSDIGVFFLITKFTRKLLYAAAWYLNPLVIFISAVWGTYDSLMLFPLVYGFVLLARDEFRLASISFVFSGLLKLFGFIPFAMLVVDNAQQRKWKDAGLQLGVALLLSAIVFLPLGFEGFRDFLVGFVLRFVGLSAVQTRAFSLLTIVTGSDLGFASSTVLIPVCIGLVLALFVVDARRLRSPLLVTLRCSIVAVFFLYLFSQAFAEWSLWIIPLSILYASIARNEGMMYYSYFYGVAATILIMMLQGSGYLLTGLPLALLPGIEQYTNSLAVYATTITSMQILLVCKMFLRDAKFSVRDLAITLAVYVASYIFFAVLRL
jgi:hypothetical protein